MQTAPSVMVRGRVEAFLNLEGAPLVTRAQILAGEPSRFMPPLHDGRLELSVQDVDGTREYIWLTLTGGMIDSSGAYVGISATPGVSVGDIWHCYANDDAKMGPFTVELFGPEDG